MISTQKRALAVDQSLEAQQSSRLIANMIVRDLRHAGFMVPASGGICGVDNRTAPDRIFISNYDAIDPDVELSADLGALLAGADAAPASGAYVSVDSLVLEQGTPAPAYDNDGDGVADTDFQVSEGVIVVDVANPGRGTACGTVTGITLPNQIRVTLDAGGLDAAPATPTPEIRLLPAVEYSVNASLQLFRGRFLVAADVEDLQVAFFFDANGDNVVDPNEYRGDGVGPDYSAQGSDASELREARLNRVVRTRRSEPEFTRGLMQATENRTPVAGSDGFRRRVHTSVVRLRNFSSRNEL